MSRRLSMGAGGIQQMRHRPARVGQHRRQAPRSVKATMLHHHKHTTIIHYPSFIIKLRLSLTEMQPLIAKRVQIESRTAKLA